MEYASSRRKTRLGLEGDTYSAGTTKKGPTRSETGPTPRLGRFRFASSGSKDMDDIYNAEVTFIIGRDFGLGIVKLHDGYVGYIYIPI